MTIAISGASGFVGNYLQEYFRNKSYEVIALQRSDLKEPQKLIDILQNVDVIINLSGATIIKRWSQAYKKLLIDSRIKTTQALVNAINSCKKDHIFISTSAIGIYKNDALYDEKSKHYSDNFLGKLCQAWEAEAHKAHARTAIFRYGIILGDGGALKKMLLPFKLGLGGRIGSGKQPFSYIHIHDLARAYEHIIEHSELQGPFNLTTPYPTDNLTLTQKLAKKLRRFALIPLPAWVVKLLFGQGASTLLEGQSVYPSRLLESGFEFHYQTLDAILDDLL